MRTYPPSIGANGSASHMTFPNGLRITGPNVTVSYSFISGPRLTRWQRAMRSLRLAWRRYLHTRGVRP